MDLELARARAKAKLRLREQNPVEDVPRGSNAPTPDISEGESLARGAHQGVTAGFQDELAGLGTYLGEKASDVVHGTDDAQLDTSYKSGRDKARAENFEAQKANPKSFLTGSIAGSVPGAIALGGENLLGTVASGAAQGGVTSIGSSDSSDPETLAKQAALGSLVGGAGGALGYGSSKALSAAPGMLASKAEKLAENATGATGRQAEKFAEDSGRYLLDNKLIKAGDNASNIADRLIDAMDKNQGDIASALKSLDEKGASIDKDMIYDALRNKLDDLKSDPASAPQARQLQSIMRDIERAPDQNVSLTAAEQTKRGFQNKAKGFYGDPYKGDALKSAGNAYKEAVETTAQDIDPSLASKFGEAKKIYGILSPIEEAASRRASTLNQSPIGGLLDTAAAGAGTLATGDLKSGGILAAARREIAPRISSTGAVTLDKISKNLDKLGKFAPIIQGALQRGPQAAAASHFVLSQTNPEYRALTQNLEGDNNENEDLPPGRVDEPMRSR